MATQSTLEILIQARDEATSKLESISESSKKLGANFTIAGGLITTALGFAVKAAAGAEEQMANVNATLDSMKGTTIEVDTGQKRLSTTLKLTGEAAAQVRNDIEGATLAINRKKMSLNDLTASLSHGKITQSEYTQKVNETKNDIADLEIKIKRYNQALVETDGKTKNVTKAVHISAEAVEKAKVGIQKAADATLNLGFDNEDASLNITKMYQRTGDLNQAVKLNAIAMDLARAKHIDLSTAGTLVNQVLSGNGKVLKQYGIDIKDSATPLEALGILHDKVSGQATAFSKTFNGQMEVAKVKFGEIAESIGGALLPILTHLLEELQPIIDKTIEWVNAHPELVKQITIAVGVLGLLLTVFGGLAVVMPVLITAFTIMTGPIGLVVLAIMSLVAATILIYKNWDKIKAYFADVWSGLKIIFKEAIDSIIGYFQPLLDMVNKVASKIGSIASAVGGKISGAVSSVGNFLTGKATGGSVFSGQPYVVGEQGPEVFVPRNSGSIIPNGAGAGGGNITVNINGGTYLSEDVAGQIGTMIIRQLQRVSRIGL